MNPIESEREWQQVGEELYARVSDGWLFVRDPTGRYGGTFKEVAAPLDSRLAAGWIEHFSQFPGGKIVTPFRTMTSLELITAAQLQKADVPLIAELTERLETYVDLERALDVKLDEQLAPVELELARVYDHITNLERRISEVLRLMKKVRSHNLGRDLLSETLGEGL